MIGFAQLNMLAACAIKLSPAKPTQAIRYSINNDANGHSDIDLFNERLWVGGAVKNINKGYQLCLYNIKTGEYHLRDLPKRGHGLCVNRRNNQWICIDRRPGNQFYCFSADSKETITKISAPKNHHFYGHAVFSKDYQFLFLTEQHWPTGEGLISVYDSHSFKRQGEFKSGGIGPHELVLNPEGTTLIIANGGIKTHPEYRRNKLNLETMHSNLCYHSLLNNKQQSFSFGHHQLSLRHLCINNNQQIAVGFQYQGEPFDVQPLIGLHNMNKAFQDNALQNSAFITALKPTTHKDWLKLHQYTASLCWVPGTSILSVTAPRANLVTFWDADTGQPIQFVTLRDAAGVTPISTGKVAVSQGTGEINVFTIDKKTVNLSYNKRITGIAWDNHLAS